MPGFAPLSSQPLAGLTNDRIDVFTESVSSNLVLTHSVVRNDFKNESLSHTIVLTHSVDDGENVSHDLVISQVVSERNLEQQDVVHSLVLTDSATYTHQSLGQSLAHSLSLTHSVVRNDFHRIAIAQLLPITQVLNGEFYALTQTLNLSHTIETNMKMESVSNTLTLIQNVNPNVPKFRTVEQTLDITQSVSQNLKYEELSNTLTITQTVVGDNTTKREEIIDALVLSQDLGLNFSITVTPCNQLTLSHKLQRAYTESVSHTLTLTHDVQTQGNIQQTLDISQVLTSNAVLKSCGTSMYVPDKSISQTLSISQTVSTTGTSSGKSVAHTLDLLQTVLYLVS